MPLLCIGESTTILSGYSRQVGREDGSVVHEVMSEVHLR